MEGKSITKIEWYQQLLKDLKKLEFTGIVLTKWNQGKRILQDELKFDKPEYGSKKIENIARDLNISSREIYRCLQFVKQYPKIDTVCQSLSWRGVIKQLQEPRPKPEILPLPEGKFRVILADPPWQFDNQGFEESAQQHYPTMSCEKICKLPIKEKIGEKAVLFLWVVNAFLEEGLRVCEEWGFEYKTNMIWIKEKGPSIGWFTRGRHEMLFIATKGEGMHPKEKFNSWFKAPVIQHSKKPELAYEMIERMYDGPYLELFARDKRENWDSWGDEL